MELLGKECAEQFAREVETAQQVWWVFPGVGVIEMAEAGSCAAAGDGFCGSFWSYRTIW